MAEIIVSTTVLILIVLILRRITFGRISMGMRYAMWLLVVVRLLLPVSFGSSPVSVLNLVWTDIYFAEVTRNGMDGRQQDKADGMSHGGVDKEETEKSAQMSVGVSDALISRKTAAAADLRAEDSGKMPDITGTYHAADFGKTADVWVENNEKMADAGIGNTGNISVGGLADTNMSGDSGADKDTAGVSGDGGKPFFVIGKFISVGTDGIVLGYAFLTIWLAGAAVVGGYMLIAQARLIRQIRRMRKAVSRNQLPVLWAERLEKHRLQVYTVAGLPSPCMAGRSIYILPELLENGEQLAHVLAHEYAHAVQQDTLWALIRSMLCAVYWFHPLVWVTAYEAKQDSELAADERAIRFLGEPERYAYGRTLLDFLGGGHRKGGCTGMVLTMDGSGKRIKERVFMIAGKKKKSGIATGIVVFIMLLACGCSFTGAEKKEADGAESVRAQNEETEASAAWQAANGKTETDAAGQLESGKTQDNQEESRTGEQLEKADVGESAEDTDKIMESLEERENELLLRQKEIETGLSSMNEAAEHNRQKLQTTLTAKIAELDAAEGISEQAENAIFIEKAIEALEKDLEELETGLQERVENLNAEREQIQKEIDIIGSKKKKIITGKFMEMLAGTNDSGLASAAAIDPDEYYDYLYNEKQNPLEDGKWYLLCRDEEDGIDFYGLFTEEFGCRGIKTLIAGDVNTFDIPWGVMSLGIEVMMLEQAEDGTPRSFAFQVCAENTGRSEVWNLYLADRYDTGTIELYSFEEEEWQEQFGATRFKVDGEEAKVSVDAYAYGDGYRYPVYIDISAYQDYKVEEVVWDGSTVGFRFYHGADGKAGSPITFQTAVGLKLAGEEEIQYSGLSLIECPLIVKGTFGDRECALGAPTVSEKNVCGMLRTVP